MNVKDSLLYFDMTHLNNVHDYKTRLSVILIPFGKDAYKTHPDISQNQTLIRRTSTRRTDSLIHGKRRSCISFTVMLLPI